ncbi:hypothetical protein HQ865_14255 [Mucilaginibacter mali]|uniref:Uncharacterized protein n=1 Tax=Mucilaginibacter mali TaxID=2740462 RepID=A0A7D4UPN6_9SPHI|nr:hypothetical protein [Mucilaginibacter mali]QKJ30860.1 hypothetical protein HQ865_14255 [Mucilaginibacter mali]
MGLSIGAVLIRQSDHTLNHAQLVKDLFGTGYNEIPERDLGQLPATKRFDTRNDNCLSVYIFENYIALVNSAFTAKFYQPGSATIQKVYQYFKQASQIFAFEHYSSGDTYSYAIIERGQLIRWVRQTSDQLHPATYGQPLNFELKILGAKKTRMRDVHGQLHTYYTHPDNNSLFPEDQLTEVLLREVMHHETGLWPNGLYDAAAKRLYFMK